MKRNRLPENGSSITEGVIWQQLLLFFFPILLGTFFQQLYNTVDAMIVGQSVGKEALAAVGGTTGTLINLLLGFFVGLSSGATVIISQYYGARSAEGVSQTVHTAAAMSLLFGALLTAVGIPLSPVLLAWMDTPEDVLPHALPYLRIYFAGMIPSLIYNVGSGILRAVGDSKRPLYFLIAACLTNIVLDLLLVLVFKWGVVGASVATVVSQTVAAALVVVTLLRSDTLFRLHLQRIHFHGRILLRVIQIGLPAGLQSVMYSLSNVLIQRAVNGFDTNVLAGWTAYGKIDSLFWMMVSAFGIAITTFVGQNFGAARYDRVRRSIRVCMGMTLGATVVMSTLLYFFGGYLYLLFTPDPAVIEEGMKILHLLVPCYFTYISIEILSGAMRGAGDSAIPTVMTLVGVCLLRIVWLAAVLPQHHTMTAVLLTYPITWIITSLMFIVYYFRGGWLKRCIRRAGLSPKEQA